MNDAELSTLKAECEQGLQDVRGHYGKLADRLRAQIKEGAMTRDEAVSWLCSNYKLTQVGAKDILDRF